MIISQIIGGLGNQMFQYAAARSLSLTRQQPLLLDVASFADYPLHQGFELDKVFHCTESIASIDKLQQLLGWQAAPLVRRVLAKSWLSTLRKSALIVEPHFHYWPGISNVPDHCYLSGYWQSERYFQAHVQQLREEFTFKPPLSPKNAELASAIKAVNAVSLHVRRGDYVSDEKNHAIYPLCTPHYYQTAIDYLETRTSNPCFFVFSDDINWTRENLKIDGVIRYIDHNQESQSFNDMRLMSLCRHHIIANSSFSWWGAWLNPDPEKIVIAPKQWFANQLDCSDLLPDKWVSL